MRRRIPKQSRGKSTDLRPTTSRVLSALFSMFGPEGVNGLKVLDLYAGTGSFGLRALERGAAQVVMVEFNRQRCDALRQAVQQHGYQNVKVVRGDALKALSGIDEQFDVVFADPPYADDPFEELMMGLEQNHLLSPDCTVMLEHFHKTELPERVGRLSQVTRRQYGDSAVSVYRCEAGTGAGSGKEPG